MRIFLTYLDIALVGIRAFCSKYKKALLGFTLFLAVGVVVGILVCLGNIEAHYKASILSSILEGTSVFSIYLQVIAMFALGLIAMFAVACGKMFSVAPVGVLVLLGYRFGKNIIALVTQEGAIGVLSLLFYEIFLTLIIFSAYCLAVVKVKESITYVKWIGIDYCNRKAFKSIIGYILRIFLILAVFCFIWLVILSGILQLIVVKL